MGLQNSKRTNMKVFATILAGLTINADAAATCPDGIYQVDCECNKFYMCADGSPTPSQNCPEGLLFNSQNDQCDWPENVECLCTTTKAPTTEAPTYWECMAQCRDELPVWQQYKCTFQCTN